MTDDPPDDEVRALLDRLDDRPRAGFVASLRDDLAGEWAQPVATAAPVTAARAPESRRPGRGPPRPPRSCSWAGAAVAVGRDDRPARIDAGPAGPAPSTSVPGATTDTPQPPGWVGTGIWPFTSDAEAAAAPADSAYRAPEFTAREFARVYLGVADELVATAVQSATGGFALRRLNGESGRPWPDAPVLSEVLLGRFPGTAP